MNVERFFGIVIGLLLLVQSIRTFIFLLNKGGFTIGSIASGWWGLSARKNASNPEQMQSFLLGLFYLLIGLTLLLYRPIG